MSEFPEEEITQPVVYESIDDVSERWRMAQRRPEPGPRCCALGCVEEAYVTHGVTLPFCFAHVKDEMLIEAWEDLCLASQR